MRVVLAAASLVAGLAFVSVPPAIAAPKSDKDICKTGGVDGPSRQKRIEACDRVLDDRKLSRNDREWFLNERGLAYFDNEDWDQAIDDFSESLKMNPKDAVVYTNRSDAYRAKKEFALAIADANRAIQLDPKYPRGFHLRGRARHDNSEHDQAIADFTQVLKIDPKFEAAFYYRGVSYLRKKDYKRSVSDLSASLKMDPQYAPAWFFRGLAYERMDELNQALVNYNKAIELDPDRGDALHNRGMIKLGRGDYDGAIADFTNAIRVSADEISHNSRGAAYRNKGEFDLAMADFNKAIEFDPKYGRPYYHRGALHLRSGNVTAALADLRKAVELDPDSKDAKESLARAEAQVANLPKQQQQASVPAAAAAALPPAPPPAATAIPGTQAAPGKRVALVIGNGKYQHSSRLANPTNDAADISRALRGLGFEVVEGRDLDRRGMDDTIRQFARKLDGASLAILFYSGHGLQVNGKNFLLPVDGKIERVADLSLDAVDVQRIIEQMEAEKRVNLIFLDACRDNPLTRSLARSMTGATRSAKLGDGLAPVQSAAGTLIAYATQPDNVALDGDGRNSPFTTALLKHMVVPGLEIETMMKQVRLDVIAATREKQVPWGHSSLIGNVYLK